MMKGLPPVRFVTSTELLGSSSRHQSSAPNGSKAGKAGATKANNKFAREAVDFVSIPDWDNPGDLEAAIWFGPVEGHARSISVLVPTDAWSDERDSSRTLFSGSTISSGSSADTSTPFLRNVISGIDTKLRKLGERHPGFVGTTSTSAPSTASRPVSGSPANEVCVSCVQLEQEDSRGVGQFGICDLLQAAAASAVHHSKNKEVKREGDVRGAPVTSGGAPVTSQPPSSSGGAGILQERRVSFAEGPASTSKRGIVQKSDGAAACCPHFLSYTSVENELVPLLAAARGARWRSCLSPTDEKGDEPFVVTWKLRQVQSPPLKQERDDHNSFVVQLVFVDLQSMLRKLLFVLGRCNPSPTTTSQDASASPSGGALFRMPDRLSPATNLVVSHLLTFRCTVLLPGRGERDDFVEMFADAVQRLRTSCGLLGLGLELEPKKEPELQDGVRKPKAVAAVEAERQQNTQIVAVAEYISATAKKVTSCWSLPPASSGVSVLAASNFLASSSANAKPAPPVLGLIGRHLCTFLDGAFFYSFAAPFGKNMDSLRIFAQPEPEPEAEQFQMKSSENAMIVIRYYTVESAAVSAGDGPQERNPAVAAPPSCRAPVLNGEESINMDKHKNDPGVLVELCRFSTARAQKTGGVDDAALLVQLVVTKSNPATRIRVNGVDLRQETCAMTPGDLLLIGDFGPVFEVVGLDALSPPAPSNTGSPGKRGTSSEQAPTGGSSAANTSTPIAAAEAAQQGSGKRVSFSDPYYASPFFNDTSPTASFKKTRDLSPAAPTHQSDDFNKTGHKVQIPRLLVSRSERQKVLSAAFGLGNDSLASEGNFLLQTLARRSLDTSNLQYTTHRTTVSSYALSASGGAASSAGNPNSSTTQQAVVTYSLQHRNSRASPSFYVDEQYMRGQVLPNLRTLYKTRAEDLPEFLQQEPWRDPRRFAWASSDVESFLAGCLTLSPPDGGLTGGPPVVGPPTTPSASCFQQGQGFARDRNIVGEALSPNRKKAGSTGSAARDRGGHAGEENAKPGSVPSHQAVNFASLQAEISDRANNQKNFKGALDLQLEQIAKMKDKLHHVRHPPPTPFEKVKQKADENKKKLVPWIHAVHCSWSLLILVLAICDVDALVVHQILAYSSISFSTQKSPSGGSNSYLAGFWIWSRLYYTVLLANANGNGSSN